MTTLQTFKQFFKDNFVFTKIINPKEISDPIAQAIKDKEIPKTDLSVIAKPILNKLTDIQDAIELQEKQESFSVENIEQARTDMSEVVSVLQNILKKETEITVEPAKTDITIDISAIVKALDSLEKAIPIIKMPNIKDYSDELLKIVSAIESKKEVDYSKFFAKIEEILHNISNKETEEYPFKFDEFNRLKVNVDHWGGGGGGLNKEESDKLLTLATEEKQDRLLLVKNPGQTLYDKDSTGLLYKGYNASPDAAQSATDWLIIKYIKTSGSLVQKITRTGSWTGRVALF